MKKRFSVRFKAIALTVALSVFWMDVVWALDPRQKLLDDAKKFLELQAGAPSPSSEQQQTLISQNEAVIDSQTALQDLEAQNSQTASQAAPAPEMTLKTSAGDLLTLQDGAITGITRADGTILTGLQFDADGKIVDANLRLNDGTIQVIQGGAAIAASLPDGTQIFYNSAGRAEKAILPSGKEIVYTYLLDASGAVTQTTAASSDSVSKYDAQNRLIETAYASGKKVVYTAGRLDRIEESGKIYQYAASPEGAGVRVRLESVTDAAGNRWTLDAQGGVTAVRLAGGTEIRAIRWQSGAIADAEVRFADGRVFVYLSSQLIRSTDAQGIQTVYTYAADRITAASQGRTTEYSLAGDPLRSTAADGTVWTYHTAGTYKGYPAQSVSAQGVTALYDYATTAGQVTAIRRETVTTLQDVATYTTSAAIGYSSNPSAVFNIRFGDNAAGRRVQVNAANTAAANIALDLVPGSGSTWKYGTAAAKSLGLTLDGTKTYTGEIRWEAAGIGIYVYEQGKVRPSVPQARITTKNWNPRFDMTATNASVLSFTPSAGTVAKTVQITEKTSAQLAGNPVHKTTLKFDTASSTNKIVLTAVQPASGTTQNTYTFTWVSGRWTLVKASKNTSTGKITNTTTTFNQALSAGRDYAAELRIENGKINLFVYDAAIARPAAATMSSAVLVSSAAISATLTNATARTEASRNVASVDPKTLTAPVLASDAAARTALASAASSAALLSGVSLPELLSADYDADGQILRTVLRDGSISEFEDGLLKRSTGQSGTTDFLFEESAYGNLAGMTMKRAGLETAYDAQGGIRSVTTGAGTAEAQTVFYQDQKVVRVEKADGTRIENIVFGGASGTEIRNASVRLPDGSVRRYQDGQPVEERKPDGTVTSFDLGKPIQTRMSDGRKYDYHPIAAAANGSGGYEMVLTQYRTASGDMVELDAATGQPFRITRENGDMLTELGFDASGDLDDYRLLARDAQGVSWELRFENKVLTEASSASGEKTFFENGRLVRSIDAGGTVTLLTYETAPDGSILKTHAAQGLEKRTFDAQSRLVCYEAEGITAAYGENGLESVSNGSISYFYPVLDAEGRLRSGQILTEDGTLHTLTEGRLERTLRPDGTEVRFDVSGTVSSITENGKLTTFEFARDASGLVTRAAAFNYGFARVDFVDWINGRANPGYWPVKGQGGWNLLTRYNSQSGVRLADGTGKAVYLNQPKDDTASKIIISSTMINAAADRTGVRFEFDNFQDLKVKKGGYIYVKLRVENAPLLSTVRIHPTFGSSATELDALAREVQVTGGPMTVLIPVDRDVTTPIFSMAIDFIPPQKAADTWTIKVEQAGFFELDTAQAKAHQSELFLTPQDAANVLGQPSLSRLPGGSGWPARALAFNRVSAPGSADIRMTVNTAGEAVSSVRADGSAYAYANGRSSRVMSADGTETEYVYDADGRVKETATRPAGGARTITRYEYGKIREVASETGAALYRYSYEFEGDREITVIEDAKTHEVKRYDAGRLLTSADAEGLLTTYGYTAEHGDRIAHSAVTWKGRQLSKFTYSYEGNETRITDEAGLAKIYDPSGKLIFIETAEGLRYKKSDLAGDAGAVFEEHALYSAKTADGMTLFYKDDTVQKILLKDGTSIDVAADAGRYQNVLLKEGLVDEVTHDDGSRAKYLRDAAGRVTFIDVTRGVEVYRYDKTGRLLRITDAARGVTTDFGFREDAQGNITHTRSVHSERVPVAGLGLPSDVRVASYGYLDGWNASITVNGEDLIPFDIEKTSTQNRSLTRGWALVHLDASGKVVKKDWFDPYIVGPQDAERMADFIEGVPAGDIVALAVADEGSKNLTERAMKAIESLGSAKIRGIGYRDSFAMIGRKGGMSGSAIEDLKRVGEGAVILSNVKSDIRYYDAAGRSIAYDDFADAPGAGWRSAYQFEEEPELEVFASADGGAAGWKKNFSPAHPDSGFVYLWGGANDPNYYNDPSRLADYAALASHAEESERYVYFDPEYYGGTGGGFALMMKQILTAKGFKVLSAQDLKEFFTTRGEGTAVMMLQSAMPETVYDPSSPLSISTRNIPREYMERGGTIVASHDLPFYYVARKNGEKTVIGEPGVRKMLGVIPTSRLTVMKRYEYEQALTARFDVAPGQAPSGVRALTEDSADELAFFDALARKADVQVEAQSRLTVGYDLTVVNGSSHRIAIQFDADGTVRADSGSGWFATGMRYEAGKPYTVEFFAKGDFTEVYVYPQGAARPDRMTVRLNHPKSLEGVFFAEAAAGRSALLGTSGFELRAEKASTALTLTKTHAAASGAAPLDRSKLVYDTDLNFRQVNWQAVKSQVGSALKAETPIVSTYDAAGRMVSLARADKTVLTYIPGTDRIDAVYDLKGYTLTQYVYDASDALVEIRNEGQRRALDEALFDAKIQAERQKFEALTDQALEAALITSDFMAQVDLQQADLNNQRNHYQNLLNELEGQKAKGSAGKKQKSATLDAYRDVIRKIDEAKAAIEEERSRQLAALSAALDQKKLQIESDFDRAFAHLDAEFAKSQVSIRTEEKKAVTIHVYREILGRDPSASELAAAQTQAAAPSALRTSLTQSSERTSRASRKAAITQSIFGRLDALLDASQRQAVLTSLGLTSAEAVSLTASEVAKLKAFLESQSLHFAESAIDPLIELLKSRGQTFTESDRTELASRMILVDILTGQIHPFLKPGEEMLVSLFAMSRTAALYGAPASGFKLTYEDLRVFSLNNDSARPVLHVDGKHYVNLVKATQSEVTFLDNGEVKVLSKEEFLKIWQGTSLLPDAHAPPALANQKISVRESKEIKGAFFFLIPAIIGAITSITAAIGGILAAIGGIIASIGAIIGNIIISLGQILGGVIQGIGTLAKAAFTGLKFAGTHLFGGGLTSLFAPATQGGFFGLSLNSLTAGSLFKSAITVGLNYGLQRGLDALGVNPGISSVLTGFLTGGFLGGISPTGFSSSLFLQAGLRGAVQAGAKTLLSASGMDSSLTDILSVTAGALAGGAWQGKIGEIFTTIRPFLAQELTAYGINKLGSSIGLDPRITSIVGSVAGGVFGGIFDPAGLIRGTIASVEDGLRTIATKLVQISLDKVGETAGLDPFESALGSELFLGAVSGLVKNGSGDQRNVFARVFDGLKDSVTQFTIRFAETFQGLSGIRLFTDLVLKTQGGLAEVLEQHATTILRQQLMERILETYDSIKSYINYQLTDPATRVEIGGRNYRKVSINPDSAANEYILVDLATDKIVELSGPNRLLSGVMTLDPDGQVRLWEGEAVYLDPDGTRRTYQVSNGIIVHILMQHPPQVPGGAAQEVRFTPGSDLAWSSDGSIVSESPQDELDWDIESNDIHIKITDGDITKQNTLFRAVAPEEVIIEQADIKASDLDGLRLEWEKLGDRIKLNLSASNEIAAAKLAVVNQKIKDAGLSASESYERIFNQIWNRYGARTESEIKQHKNDHVQKALALAAQGKVAVIHVVGADATGLVIRQGSTIPGRDAVGYNHSAMLFAASDGKPYIIEVQNTGRQVNQSMGVDLQTDLVVMPFDDWHGKYLDIEVQELPIDIESARTIQSHLSKAYIDESTMHPNTILNYDYPGALVSADPSKPIIGQSYWWAYLLSERTKAFGDPALRKFCSEVVTDIIRDSLQVDLSAYAEDGLLSPVDLKHAIDKWIESTERS